MPADRPAAPSRVHLALIAVASTAILGGLAYGATVVGTMIVPTRTFYVSAAGSDSNNGLSTEHPWATLGPVNDKNLHPGDRVLLESSATFTQPLRLDSRDGGDPKHPIVITTSGSARARIAPPSGSAISIANTSGIRIGNLELVGHGNPDDGIRVANTTDSDQFSGITIDGVEASGFRNGIAVTATRAHGFDDVSIRACDLHDNVAAGIATSGSDSGSNGYAHRKVVIENVRAWHNTGDPQAHTNTGSGIVLGDVDGGVVRGSAAYGNGGNSDTTEGPVGIWAYQANNIVFEHNLSWGNRTSGADGGGFDFDHGVTNSVMQYNLSHDNHAYGYLLYTNDSPTKNLHNVLRYNVSYDDSASGTPFYGAITLLGGLSGPHAAGGLRGVSVYNNTVIASAGLTGLPQPLAHRRHARRCGRGEQCIHCDECEPTDHLDRRAARRHPIPR